MTCLFHRIEPGDYEPNHVCQKLASSFNEQERLQLHNVLFKAKCAGSVVSNNCLVGKYGKWAICPIYQSEGKI